jgi:hypothetical protein
MADGTIRQDFVCAKVGGGMGEAPRAMAGGVKHSAHSEVNCSEIAFAIALLSLDLVGQYILA